MTRIETTPVFLTLDAEATTSAPARQPDESSSQEGFAEVFAGVQVGAPPAAPASPTVAPVNSMDATVTLRRVELSPAMRLIMPASPVPDASSLHAFARMQGLDESAIAQLFGQDTTVPQTVSPQVLGDGVTPPGNDLLDPAAAILAAPLVMMGLGPEGSAATATQAHAADSDTSQILAGNMLSMGLQRFLPSSRVQMLDVSVTTSPEQAANNEVEIIPLELSLPDQVVDPQNAPEPMVQMAKVGAPGAVQSGSLLGTWDAMGGITSTDAGVAASVTALSKTLRGQPLMAADLASLSQNSFEEALVSPEVGLASEVSDSGGAGQGSSGWTAANTASSSQPLTVVDAMDTGDVAISRQLGEQLAQRMGEQIAQRLANKLAQGEWQFKFVINPKNLGEIQVNLRMHAGSLDGTFMASQSATREMLGEGLQRLRDVLTGVGMNVASLDVGADHSSRQGRQAMTAGQTAPAFAQQGLQPSTQESMAVRRTDMRGGDQGWDVLV